VCGPTNPAMLTLDVPQNEVTNVLSTMSSIYKMSSFLVQFFKKFQTNKKNERQQKKKKERNNFEP
jgi:hypothetical protein